jgi:hypothetical protein
MASLTASPTSLSLLDGANGFRLAGAAAGDRFGVAVSGAGDGDGADYLYMVGLTASQLSTGDFII